jgi:hypothetical protein
MGSGKNARDLAHLPSRVKALLPFWRLFVFFVLCRAISACGVDQCPANTVEKQGTCLPLDSPGATVAPVAMFDGGSAGSGRNGALCEGDSACDSGRCSNHVCCESGRCCRDVDDCGVDAEGLGTACEDPSTCQGSRGELACDDFQCRTIAATDDDSGCTAQTEADDCGPFESVFCDGARDQVPPSCAETCQRDTDCDPGLTCRDERCVAASDTSARAADGSSCTADGDCNSDHCQNGRCCADGDCCAEPEDCSTSYSKAPICEDAQTCTGTRGEPSCEGHVCKTKRVDDDSACDSTTVLATCASGTLYCSGQTEQTDLPACGPTCSSDSNCPSDQRCGGGGECVADLADGETCSRAGMCASGHCRNATCCSNGDCCRSDATCRAVIWCDDTTTCDGNRQERACVDFKCEDVGGPVPDDTACALQRAASCGANRDVYCVAAVSYDPPACGRTCTSDGDCNTGYLCDTTVGLCRTPEECSVCPGA